MKTAIYGAGSLGTILGAYMTKAGFSVDLINHNAKHVAALKERGAHIVGTVEMNVPVSALLPEEMSDPYDVIFLMTKQLDNEQVVRSLLPYLTADGVRGKLTPRKVAVFARFRAKKHRFLRFSSKSSLHFPQSYIHKQLYYIEQCTAK